MEGLLLLSPIEQMGKVRPRKAAYAPSHTATQGLKPLLLPIPSVLWASVSPPALRRRGRPEVPPIPYSPYSQPPSFPPSTERGPGPPFPLGPPNTLENLPLAVPRPRSPRSQRLDPDSPRPPPGCNRSCLRHSPGGNRRRELTPAVPLPPRALTHAQEVGAYRGGGSPSLIRILGLQRPISLVQKEGCHLLRCRGWVLGTVGGSLVEKNEGYGAECPRLALGP